MRFNVITTSLVSLLVGAGCTKGSPGFSVLNQGAIPQPMFDGQTSRTIARATTAETTLVSGQCDPRIRAINVTVVGYAALTGGLGVISVGTPGFDCAGGGTFSLTLKSLTDLVVHPVANETYRIELRADTAGGVSSPSLLLVTYTRDTWERWNLSQGGTEGGGGTRLATSSGFKADLRVINLVGDGDTNVDAQKGVARSTHFVMKHGRAAR